MRRLDRDFPEQSKAVDDASQDLADRLEELAKAATAASKAARRGAAPDLFSVYALKTSVETAEEVLDIAQRDLRIACGEDE